ncbi:unnamed protein product, partial [Symbiodinium pilosum]
DVRYALVSLSRLPVFSHDFGLAFKDDLDLLHTLKQLKYFWNLPQSQLAILMANLARRVDPASPEAFDAFTEQLCQSPAHLRAIKEVSKELPSDMHALYMDNAAYLEDADAHAVYPTSIYRQCDALTLATKDASTIEAVMSTTITTTIKIARKVLDPSNHLLFDMYKPLGRCVAVVDDKVDEHYGAEIDNYFATHNIEFTKLVFSGNEVDKGIEDVERILVAMKKYSVDHQDGGHEGLAVGTCMGFGAYLSFVEGWVSEEEMHRILKVISDCELSLYHPVMDDDQMIWKTQMAIVEKRGGNLCAPIPKPLGFSGYLNDLSEELLAQRMHEYKDLVSKYP